MCARCPDFDLVENLGFHFLMIMLSKEANNVFTPLEGFGFGGLAAGDLVANGLVSNELPL